MYLRIYMKHLLFLNIKYTIDGKYYTSTPLSPIQLKIKDSLFILYNFNIAYNALYNPFIFITD